MENLIKFFHLGKQMVTIRAFQALRPLPEMAPSVASVPYDVISTSQARAVIAKNPLSFLRISVSEAEFREEISPTSEEIFKKASENLNDFIRKGIFLQDQKPSVYVYRISSNERSQTGLVACCSLDEYEKGLIKPHETTRFEKVRNRTNQMLALKAHTGLIFLIFRKNDKIKSLLEDASTNTPIYDFYCDEGLRQIIWQVHRPELFVEAFSKIPTLYIADGHHRMESALQVRNIMKDQSKSNSPSEHDFVMAGIFPSDELRILPYNRLIKNVNGLTEEKLFEELEKNFKVEKTSQKKPSQKSEFCMYLGKGRWYKLRFIGKQPSDAVEKLDVSILQNFILSKILGIKDPRSDDRIDFVGGKNATFELEKQVDCGKARLGFSLFPTSIEELFEIADAGKVMPPKSTWFEPKLKDGLLIHPFGEVYESNANYRSF